MSRSRSGEVIIEPGASGVGIGRALREIFAGRELLFILAMRAIQVRYKQTLIGVAWVVLQPLVLTGVFTIVFGRIAQLPSDGLPYEIFALTGVLLWQYFSRTVTESTNSLVSNYGIITKVYFPRIILPLTPAVSLAFDFAVSLVVLLVLMLIFGVPISIRILAVPVVILTTGLLAYGVGLLLAPLNALYRDVAIAIPLVLQLGMYASLVAFPLSAVPVQYHWLFELNPAATLVTFMRWAAVGGPAPSALAIGVLVVATLAILLAGAALFRRLEPTIVDRI